MRFVVGFFRFWYDFIVGDDWRIAAGIVAVLAPGALLVASTSISDAAISVLMLGGIVTVIGASLVTAG